jgi:hypothetical protein
MFGPNISKRELSTILFIKIDSYWSGISYFLVKNNKGPTNTYSEREKVRKG